MGNNSAHAEISILSQDVEDLKLEISTQEPKQAKHLHVILDILAQWQLAREAGEAVVTNQTYQFEGKDAGGEQLVLTLNAQAVEYLGWAKHLNPRGTIAETGLITAFERYALSDKKQSVDISSVSLPEQENMTFSHFAEQLEAFGVGRPSTYANIFDRLTTYGLMDMDGGTIRMTNLGAKAYEELQRCFPLDALSVCTTFEDTMERLGRGEESLQSGVYKLLTQWEQRVDINDVFESLDDISFDGLVD
ncbi:MULTISPECIES: DNA topoisomerase [Vibrio]|uniref:DNA topoisomerase n=1 Tax=Vibrio TaxID=662 RepID=UPI0001B93B9D|nr:MULTISPECIES: DNA topoisomerase [Vibrio]EEX34432.1 hypothetical protein VIC_001230 [Vibrio coralliilyticus ATCC BAA-450]MDE3898472.1 hypothetical protein [Vibrio sp. CC007]